MLFRLQILTILLCFSFSSLAQREGAFRVPISKSTAISTENAKGRNNIVVSLPNGNKFQLYQISGKKLIEGATTKQYYVDFDQSKEIDAGKEVTFNGAYLSREIIQQLTKKFNPKNDSSLISKMNSASEKEWKELLFGVDSSDITRLAGVSELKRRYQDVDEHLNLMLNESYSDKDFEKSYFIPTGFIEVDLGNGDIAFLKATDLIKKNIKIDVNNFKVSILKNTLLYFIEDLNKEQDVDSSLLNTAFDLASCLQECILKQSNFGDLILNVINIQNSSSSPNEKTLNLIRFYKNLCEDDNRVDTLLANYRKNKDQNLSNQDINNYFKFVLEYPDLSISYYKNAISKLQDSNLVPYALVNKDKKINDRFKNLAIDAFNSGLTPEGLKNYFTVAQGFGGNNKLSPSYYANLLNFLEPDYIEWVIGPYYKEIQKNYANYKITVEEFIHLINFAGGQETLLELLKNEPDKIRALRKNRASIFWVFPNRQNQNRKAADIMRKSKK